MNKQPQSAPVVQKSKPTPIRMSVASLPTISLTALPQPLMTGMKGSLRPQNVLHLQRTIGNRAVQRLLNNSPDPTPEHAVNPSLESENSVDESAEEQVELDLDEDGEPERHTLSVDAETGQLMIHSDPETLEDFLKKYQRKLNSPNDQKILLEIKGIADTVHIGRYGTKYIDPKGYTKTKAPTVSQRSYVKPQLILIAQKLRTLTHTKYRPLSHKATHKLKDVDGETFCKKIVMEPLSLLPRDDNVEGSPPSQETKLWRSLTNFAGYKRGHMLNEHLHGPGTNDNLVPISTAFNATMREGVEKAAKKAVNSQNKVVRLEVEALDWGLFPGAFGFPEEKKLPNKFHFKLQQMKKKVNGGNGSNRGDWETTGPVLFDDTPTHDIPTDVIKGVVAPTVKTFVPGLYFHPYGSVKNAPTNFHLKGSFSINNLMNYDVLAGLGIDEAKNLKYTSIDETVLTEYQLPMGYDIKRLVPTEIEYEYYGKLAKYRTPAPAFVIYNIAAEARLQQEHDDKVKLFKEQQKLLAQQKLDLEQQRKLEQLRLINEHKMQEEERRRKEEEEQQRMERDKEFRGKLYTQIRNETAGYLEEYGEDFEKARESILYETRGTWLGIPDLIDRDMETLLQPVREHINEAVSALKAGQERKEEVIAELFNQFKDVFTTYPNELGVSEGKEEFKANAAAAYERHEEKWEATSLFHWVELDSTYWWESLQRELDKILRKAAEWEGEHRSRKVDNALREKYWEMIKKYRAELIHDKAKRSFDKKVRERYEKYKQVWQKESSDKTVAELWIAVETQLQSDFEKAEIYDMQLQRRDRNLKEEKKRGESPRHKFEDDRWEHRREREREERDDWKTKETSSQEKKRSHDQIKEGSDKYRRTNLSGPKNYKKSTSEQDTMMPDVTSQNVNNTPPVFSFPPFPNFNFNSFPQNRDNQKPGEDKWY